MHQTLHLSMGAPLSGPLDPESGQGLLSHPLSTASSTLSHSGPQPHLRPLAKADFHPVQGTVSGKNRPSIIYPGSMRSKGFYSRMFAVPQMGWGCISLFWSHWTHTSWIYSLRDLLNQGNRIAKLDLYVHVCYTYLTVPIHFVWEGEVYQFQVLLFGLASATPVFIKLPHTVMAAALLTYTISSSWPIPRATHQSGWFDAPVPGFRSQCKEVCNQSNTTDGVHPLLGEHASVSPRGGGTEDCEDISPHKEQRSGYLYSTYTTLMYSTASFVALLISTTLV